MKFLVEASAMSAALAIASKITERRNTIPILSNVRLEAVGDHVMIKSTDLDIEITLAISAKVVRAGATTVPSRLLADLMRKTPAGAEATFEASDRGIEVKAGRSNYRLQTLPVEDFPEMSGANYSNNIEMTGETMHRLMSTVQFAISTEETRYYLNGIYLHTKEDDGKTTMRAVATDGHRLAKMQIDRPAGAADMPAIIIPRKTVAEIFSLTQGVTENVVLDVSETKVRLTVGKTVLISKLIDGTYPDYERVVPALSNSIARVNSKTLATSADRVATMSTAKGRAVKFDVKPGTMVLTVVNPDAGDAVDEIDIDYAGAPVEVGFNSKYLLDALNAISGTTASISLTDAGSPARFFSETDTDESLLIVLMPMRV